MPDRLYLMGHSSDDVAVISALVQDAAVRCEDLCYDRRARRFVLLLNRFCWEKAEPARTRAALRIDCVTGVKCKAWPTEKTTVLDLLAVTAEEDAIRLDFAGGHSLRLEVECVDVMLEDLAGPWGTKVRPKHAV